MLMYCICIALQIKIVSKMNKTHHEIALFRTITRGTFVFVLQLLSCCKPRTLTLGESDENQA